MYCSFFSGSYARRSTDRTSGWGIIVKVSVQHLHLYVNLYAYLHTVPLNCNFIFPRVILHGTMTILQRIPVMWLRGPRLLVSCNVHVLWKYTSRGSTCMEVHAWKVYAWNKRHVYLHVETYLSSLSHCITSIFCWLTNTMSCMVSSVAHI